VIRSRHRCCDLFSRRAGGRRHDGFGWRLARELRVLVCRAQSAGLDAPRQGRYSATAFDQALGGLEARGRETGDVCVHELGEVVQFDVGQGTVDPAVASGQVGREIVRSGDGFDGASTAIAGSGAEFAGQGASSARELTEDRVPTRREGHVGGRREFVPAAAGTAARFGDGDHRNARRLCKRGPFCLGGRHLC